jgi:hypothetical protein
MGSNVAVNHPLLVGESDGPSHVQERLEMGDHVFHGPVGIGQGAVKSGAEDPSAGEEESSIRGPINLIDRLDIGMLQSGLTPNGAQELGRGDGGGWPPNMKDDITAEETVAGPI